MSDLKVLSVQKRAGLGKGANRRARQEELIPGVFYTAKGENLPVQMAVRSFAKLFSQVGRTTVFNLEIEGDGTHPVLIWATQRDPITSRFTHIDFYGVDLDKPVKITVPVEFTGVARGTKVGGKLETYREQVVDAINNDIVLRHGYTAGVIEHALPGDREVTEAVAVLRDSAEYARITREQDTRRK